MTEQGIEGLAGFVKGLQPGERNKGLFWAACRAAADGLAMAPLVTAAEESGLSRDEAEHAAASAAAHIAKARKEHESLQPSQHGQPSRRD